MSFGPEVLTDDIESDCKQKRFKGEFFFQVCPFLPDDGKNLLNQFFSFCNGPLTLRT
jgi:hypothetical protein